MNIYEIRDQWLDRGNFFLDAHGIQNFRAHEIADVGRKRIDGDGGEVFLLPPPPELMLNALNLVGIALQWVRDYKRTAPVRVISWYRDPAYNRTVSNATQSLHLDAAGADIVKPGFSGREIALALHREHPDANKLGIGLYGGGSVHVDIRGFLGRAAPARWGVPGWWHE